MKDINRVVITGRLTKDAESRYTNNGTAIASLSIATNYSVKKGDNWTEEASFFDCTMIGKRAEALFPYLTKGQQVAIDGQLRQERWEKDGQKRSAVKIIIDDINLIGSKKDQNQGSKSGGFEDDIPFG